MNNDNPKVYTLANALEPQPDIDWIVNDFISTGSLVMFAGDPGSGKTWALLDMAVCVALGEVWLEHDTKPGVVLIVDEESGARRLHRRIGQAARGHPPERSEAPLKFTTLNAFDLPGNEMQLEDLINREGAQLVIIDTLADVMPGRDENAVKDVQPVFLALRRISERTTSAIVLIHHTGKAGGYRGSSAMAGAVDLLVEVSRSGKIITFKTTKERDIDQSTIGARLEITDTQAYLIPADIELAAGRLSEAEQFVVTYLASCMTCQQAELIKAAADEGFSNSSARWAVRKLKQSGSITRQDAGDKGKAATLEITKDGSQLAEKLKG